MGEPMWQNPSATLRRVLCEEEHAGEEGSEERAQFKEKFLNDLAKQLGVSVDRLEVEAIFPDSGARGGPPGSGFAAAPAACRAGSP